MRYLFSAVVLAAFMILASGCRNPMPSFNPYGGFGSPRVAPPAIGGYPASGTPAQPGAYNQGIQQPSSIPGTQNYTAPGYTPPGYTAPAYNTPAPTSGFQSQNQQPVGTGTNGWQASNGVGTGTATASTAGMPETAVNRVTTPSITNGTLNEASIRQSNSNDPAAGLMQRIQQGRMRVHDATAPAGAAAPVPVFPTVPVYPTVPAYPTYQVQAGAQPVPGYAHLRGAQLTRNSPPVAPAANSPSQAGRSVLVSGGFNRTASTSTAPAATAPPSTSTSADGLTWRSKHSPVVEVATR